MVSQRSQSGRFRVSRFVPEAIRKRFVRKFVAAVLVAVLVAGGIGAAFYVDTTRTLDQRVESQVVSTAQLQAEGLDNWVDGFRRQTRTLSSVKEFQNGQPDVIKDYLLLESSDLTSEFVAVHYVQASDGTVEASTANGIRGQTLAELGVPWGSEMGSIDSETDTPGTVVVPEEPYKSPVTNDSVLAFVSSPPQNTEHIVVVEANLSARTEGFRGSMTGGETTILGPNGSAVVGERVPTASATAFANGDGNGFKQSSGTVYGYANLDSVGWTVVTHVPASSAYAIRNQIGTSLLLTLVSALVVLGGVTIGMEKRSATALSELAATADEMKTGELDVTLDTRREDEIGRLVDAFDEMRRSLRDQIADAESARSEAESAKQEAEIAREDAMERSEQLQAQATAYGDVINACADGDLTARMATDADNESMAHIATTYNAMLDEWEDTIREVRSFSESVQAASGTVSENVGAVHERSASVDESATEMADGADAQSAKLATVLAELEDLSATVEEVSTAADTVRNRADEALDRSQDGRMAAQRAATALDEIETSTGKTVAQVEELDSLMSEVEAVTDLITDIADQTTMLALNANIEAVRAGTEGAGDGFAVVADEVKTLADETVTATDDIEAAIGEMREQVERTVDEMHATQAKVDTGTETVGDALAAFDGIVNDIEDATTGMREIDSATDQQAASTQEVVTMVEEVSDISDDTAAEAASVADAATEQVAAVDSVDTATSELSERATDLGAVLETFTVEGQFDSSSTDTDVFDAAAEDHTEVESPGDD